MSITTTITQTIDLDRGVGQPQPLYQRLVYGNEQAHTFLLRCTRQGVEVLLGDTLCKGFVRRSDGVTVALDGSVRGCEASITLTDACYAVPGNVTISLELITGSVRATHGLWLAEVQRTTTDSVGGDAATSISEALERIDAIGRPDWQQNNPSMPDYVLGRTHYMQTSRIDCTADLGSFDSWRKVSDHYFPEWMIGVDQCSLLLQYEDGPQTISPMWTVSTSDGVLCSLAWVDAIYLVVMVVHEDGYALGKGVYVTTKASYPSVLAMDWGEAVPLADCYIPDTIARKASIPPLDPTLTEGGSSADAGAVGERIALLSPAIVPEASGDVAVMRDSAARPLEGMCLHGRTTQAGSPSLASPAAMVNAGSAGSLTLSVLGKNLLDLTQHTASSNAVIELNDGTMHVYTTSNGAWLGARMQTLRLLKGVSYTLSAKVDSLVSGSPTLGFRGTADNKFLKRANVVDGRITVTYTPDADVEAYVALLVVEGTAGMGDATFSELQLEIGPAATAYRPYEEGGQLTVPLDSGLPGVPVSSGGSYTDSSGQQWFCDEIDFERGVYIQRVAAIDSAALTGWNASSLVNANGHVYIHAFPEAKPAGALWTTRKAASTPAAITKDQFVIQQNSSGVTVLYIVSDASTAAQAAASIQAESSTLLYALAEPVERKLTLPALTLRSQSPCTTVLNDGGAGMTVAYMADPKTYIDLKLADIAAAMLSL